MSQRTKVLIYSGPNTAVENPADMTYGGVERAAYWYSEGLYSAGFDVLPVMPADSKLPFAFDKRALWPHNSFWSKRRTAPVPREQIAGYQADLAQHLVRTVGMLKPDVLLLLGPNEGLVNSLLATDKSILGRTIVSLRNGPAHYGQALLDTFSRHPEIKLIALTELHRQSFGPLASQIEVIREGIKLSDFPASVDPGAQRSSSISGLIRNPARRLVSQIDSTSPSKGQLLALHMFEAAGLHKRGFDFVLGGAFGSQAPSADPNGPYAGAVRYKAAMDAFINERGLRDYVYDIGLLKGSEVAEIYRCSDFVFAPHRMDHGAIWPWKQQSAEAYGRAMAIALASGAPVLASNMVDPGRSIPGVTGYTFDNLSSGVKAAMRMAQSVEQGTVDRAAIRRFAETADNIEPAIAAYGALCLEIGRSRSLGELSL